MKNEDIANFIEHVTKLDANFDEFQMLISILVREAAEEHTHTTLMEDTNYGEPNCRCPHCKTIERETKILCPECQQVNKVYHLDWEAVQCQACKAMVNKRDWEIII